MKSVPARALGSAFVFLVGAGLAGCAADRPAPQLVWRAAPRGTAHVHERPPPFDLERATSARPVDGLRWRAAPRGDHHVAVP